ncbi:hypothetical protein STIAU_2879 [Stigmatella aurantiaca DW4/3-1]|uniref:Uncharacterized protein n=1 Tax=Stigmatella aurantiaca (strain DW4/3-1) TaxID=378806 RepID=Q08Y61_STIAD|nr:hypothetical protein STIAU_2879 [Stigmatella aurantiaca DW4/3-1]
MDLVALLIAYAQTLLAVELRVGPPPPTDAAPDERASRIEL